MKDLYEVELLGTTLHTEIVQGELSKVEEWAEKEAKAYGAKVIGIRKVPMPNTRVEREKV